MPQAPIDPDADDRARRTNRGCWIAVAIGFALMAGAAVLAAVLVTQIIEDSPIPEWGKRVGEGADILLDAQSGPAAHALRSEGCDAAAMVVDVERTLDFLDDLEDAGSFRRPAHAPAQLALCTSTSSPPACDDLAKIVAREGSPKGELAVVASEQAGGRRRPVCSGRYDRAGSRIGSYAPGTVPVPQK